MTKEETKSYTVHHLKPAGRTDVLFSDEALGLIHLLSVSRIERRSAEFEPVDEEPRTVPAHRLDAISSDQ